MEPLRLIDLIGSYRAVFDSSANFKFGAPARPVNAIRYALVDGASVLPGDYLIGAQETHFIAQMPDFQSIMCVLCNSVVTVLRTVRVDQFGSIEPPGTTEDVPLLKGWPASLLMSGRGPGDDVSLPGDINPAQYEVLLPPIANIELPRAGDVVVDDHNQRFAVIGFDHTAAGWRLTSRLLAA
jgi:hypothetical protein